MTHRPTDDRVWCACQARAAEAASARTALGAAQAKVSSLTEAVTGLEREMETLRAQKAAADERCQALANKGRWVKQAAGGGWL